MHRLTKNINYGIPGISHILLKNFMNDNNLKTAINLAIPELTIQNYNDFQTNILNLNEISKLLLEILLHQVMR